MWSGEPSGWHPSGPVGEAGPLNPMTPTWPPDGYLTLAGLAKVLGISRQRAYVLVKSRGVPTYPTVAGKLVAVADLPRLTRPAPEGPR